MGWLISYNLTKEQQVAELVKGWEEDGRGVRFLAHSVRGNTLYAVGQPFRDGRELIEDRFIFICLLRKDRGMGWGYKDMDESMNPYQYDCPLKFLKMVPTVASEKWREGVRAHHERMREKQKQANKIEPGMRFQFADGFKDSLGHSLNGVTAKIVGKRGRCYIAEIGYMPIRVQRRHIGKILPTEEQVA